MATKEERNEYYRMSRKGEGFTAEERRLVWLQVTGAQGLMNASLAQRHADYQTLISTFDT